VTWSDYAELPKVADAVIEAPSLKAKKPEKLTQEKVVPGTLK
jgi:hypothetical protein